MPRFEVHIPARPQASSVPEIPAIPSQRPTPHGQPLKDYLSLLSSTEGPLVFLQAVGYNDREERETWSNAKRHAQDLATLDEWYRAPLYGRLARIGYFHHPVATYRTEHRLDEDVEIQN